MSWRIRYKKIDASTYDVFERKTGRYLGRLGYHVTCEIDSGPRGGRRKAGMWSSDTFFGTTRASVAHLMLEEPPCSS